MNKCDNTKASIQIFAYSFTQNVHFYTKTAPETPEIISSLKHSVYLILLSHKLRQGIVGQRVSMTKHQFKLYCKY